MKKIIISLLLPISILSQTVTDIDGNVYQTTVINGVEWMTSNLRTFRFQNGDTIPWQQNGDLTNVNTPVWVYEFNDSLSATNWELNNGLLYNWYTAIDPRNVCPTGWEVPTVYDFTDLRNYLEDLYPMQSGIVTKSTTGWTFPTTNIPVGNGNNLTGFNLYPSGWRTDSISYGSGWHAGFWSNTLASDTTDPNDPFDGWGAYVTWDWDEFMTGRFSVYSADAIRCLKRIPTNPTVGLNPTNNIEINVYPNPTNDFINIDAEDLVFAELYNFNGMLLGTYNNLQINLQNFNKGTYILKIVTQNTTKEVKILKN